MQSLARNYAAGESLRSFALTRSLFYQSVRRKHLDQQKPNNQPANFSQIINKVIHFHILTGSEDITAYTLASPASLPTSFTLFSSRWIQQAVNRHNAGCLLTGVIFQEN
ncbi:hypothetical protein DT73_17110 [Mangrovibacter sp. MFB070]|nr:hypothetical protein DT73_17110 [Mangrovibacter sp. MFB070]